jgi:hypothetical protein
MSTYFNSAVLKVAHSSPSEQVQDAGNACETWLRLPAGEQQETGGGTGKGKLKWFDRELRNLGRNREGVQINRG